MIKTTLGMEKKRQQAKNKTKKKTEMRHEKNSELFNMTNR